MGKAGADRDVAQDSPCPGQQTACAVCWWQVLSPRPFLVLAGQDRAVRSGLGLDRACQHSGALVERFPVEDPLDLDVPESGTFRRRVASLVESLGYLEQRQPLAPERKRATAAINSR